MRRCVFVLALAVSAWALPATRGADQDVPEGFQPLFNGKDLSGWTVNEGGKIDRWGAEDGILFTTGKAGGGWLMTEKEYGDFELLLEYKVPNAGNSGVALRSPLKGDPAYVGMEIQILDNPWYQDENKYKGGIKPVQLTGAIYGVVPPATDATKKAGTWNRMHITAKGRHVTVEVNGTKVVDADLDDYKEHAKQHPGLLRETGHVGLQCHTDRVEFRHVYVKPL
jgi:hypothetical protein